jgi:FkbH-like protein
VKITEALKIQQSARADAAPFAVDLICGFTPLHLQTLIGAHLQKRLPDRRVTVHAGLFGDVAGTLEACSRKTQHAIAIALEWQDLDARLGYRGAGKWGLAQVSDILTGAQGMLDRIAIAIDGIPTGIPVACSLPTLPLPPIFYTPGWQMAEAELALEAAILQFAARILGRKTLALVNSRRLGEDSPSSSRLDLKSDLVNGLPYTVPHADSVAFALTRLILPPLAKKGLITDLDDTLWHGLVGEIGPENVKWDLDSHQQLHGLYQKTLATLADEGVLVGIASKNDPGIAAQALQRPDILLPPERVFPVEVHWEAKSGSVGRILQAWNIGADSVVFVDDSPMELAEVAAAHPGIECLQYPGNDAGAGLALLRRLRDLFGRPRLSEEDALRADSLRQGAAFRSMASATATADAFLQQAEAVITIDSDPAAHDSRALELVNKTNQFNLNGRRYAEADWRHRLSQTGAVLSVVSYQDKFGQLGKIAVLQGWQDGESLHIDTWVMSCRAFSRRVEHQCLKSLFEQHGAAQILLEFSPTAKNGPLQDFFATILGERPDGPFVVTRVQFEQSCPPLYHRVTTGNRNANEWMTSNRA